MNKRKKGTALKAFLPKGWRIIVEEGGGGLRAVYEATDDTVVTLAEPEPVRDGIDEAHEVIHRMVTYLKNDPWVDEMDSPANGKPEE